MRETEAVAVAPEPASAVAALGLGCSRLGSVLTGGDLKGAERLVREAIEMGVRHFDTANIYGQGDSERVLGRVLRDAPQGVLLASKVGQRLPLAKRLLVPLKKPLTKLVGLSAGLKAGVASERSKRLPTEFDPVSIRRAAERSLRRLERDHVDVFYLHGPSADELRAGEAVGALADLRAAGKLRWVGVSCDTREEARLAAADARVDFVQFPFGQSREDFAPEIAAASAAGKTVVAREILSGVRERMGQPETVADAVRFAARHPGVNVALLGSTNPRNLAFAVAAVSGAA